MADGDFGPLPSLPPLNPDNPMTEEKVELGKKLFFDPCLSGSNIISCNTCHNLATGGVDGLPTSLGHNFERGGRNAPTVLNSAFWSAQFWDGRAPTLEEQAKGPVLNPIEMAMPDGDTVVKKLKAIPGYEEEFRKVFGGRDPLTYQHVADAIAAFERTLITPNAPFDRYLAGEDGAISEQAKRGFKTVQEAGCTACHSGPLFTNNTFVPFKYGKDLGRYEVTKKEEDRNVFRVQSWRNVALTAPYFHDGSAGTLEEAVRTMAKVQLGKKLSKRQVSDIVAFLKSLTGDQPTVVYPTLPQ
ncbi:MAG: cytochrome-c peroxidase [Thermodesulfobacteriota bacterium]